MYCENCGNEIEKDPEFCVYCGEKVKKDMGTEAVLMAGNMNRKKKYRKGIIATVIMTAMLLAVFIGAWIHNAPARHLMEQLNLGNRYLEEMDYEQAVVAFTKAIEIDPMSVDAYIGAAEAYVGLDDVDEAIIVLEKGYELTDAEEILRMLEELRESREEKNEETEEVVESVLEENDEDILPYYELGFSPEDFTIAGYSVMDGNHMEEILEKVRNLMPDFESIDYSMENPRWSYRRYEYRGTETLEILYHDANEPNVYDIFSYSYIAHDNSLFIRISDYFDKVPADELFIYEGKVIPYVTSYEETLDLLGIKQLIQEYKEKLYEESIDGFYFKSQYGNMSIVESTWMSGREDDFEIFAFDENGNRKWEIYMDFKDDVLIQIWLTNFDLQL